MRAADVSVKSAQAPRPRRQALVKTIWRGSDRVESPPHADTTRVGVYVDMNADPGALNEKTCVVVYEPDEAGKAALMAAAKG